MGPWTARGALRSIAAGRTDNVARSSDGRYRTLKLLSENPGQYDAGAVAMGC